MNTSTEPTSEQKRLSELAARQYQEDIRDIVRLISLEDVPPGYYTIEEIAEQYAAVNPGSTVSKDALRNRIERLVIKGLLDSIKINGRKYYKLSRTEGLT